jgi:hypothetical protein
VPVTSAQINFKPGQLGIQRIHRGELRSGAEPLQAIVVDQDRQIRQVVVASEDQRLQGRALLPFAVRGQAEDAVRFAFQPRRQRQTGGERETMP